MVPEPGIWAEFFPKQRLMQAFYEMPRYRDGELDTICTSVATDILELTWKKLRDKRRPWKITCNSEEHDMTRSGNMLALYAIRIGYGWRMACTEKDHLHYLARAAQCNKTLYCLLRIFKDIYTWKPEEEKRNTRKPAKKKTNTWKPEEEKTIKLWFEKLFCIDSATYQIIDTNGREFFQRNTCTYDVEIEALREIKMSKQELQQKEEKLRDKIEGLKKERDANFRNISLWLGGEMFAWDKRNRGTSWLESHRTDYHTMRELVLAQAQLSKCLSWLSTLEKEEQTSQAGVSNAPETSNTGAKKVMEQTSVRVTETNGVKRKELRERSILYGHMVTSFFMAFGRRKHPMAKTIGWEALRNVSELGALCYAASVETVYPNYRHDFATCKQFLYGLFYWMKLLTNAKVFQSVKKRGELCRAGLGLYNMMLDVVRNGGFVPEQCKKKKRGEAAEAESSSPFCHEIVTLKTIQEHCERLATTVRKVCEKCPCDADGVEGVLLQQAINCGDSIFTYSKRIGRYDFIDMVTYCEKLAHMGEYYLLLAEEFLPYHKEHFVFIRQKMSALAEALSRFSVYNDLEYTQKYNLPFPEPAKRSKSKKRTGRKREGKEEEGFGPPPELSGK